MRLTVKFYSYFRDLTGCDQVTESLREGSSLGDLMEVIHGRFSKLAPLRQATLMAVGVEYQNRDYVLKEGDEVSLFPPVQGG